MYSGYGEYGYADTLGQNASGDEDSAESELDDLETRLYSQIHYGDQMSCEDGDQGTQSFPSEAAKETFDLITQGDEKDAETTRSLQLSDLYSAPDCLPSTTCPSNQNMNQTIVLGSSIESVICEKETDPTNKEDSLIVIDSSVLSTDNTESGEILMIDRLGGQETNIGEDENKSEKIKTGRSNEGADTLKITKDNYNKRRVEYIVVDTESDGIDDKKPKKTFKKVIDKKSTKHVENTDLSDDSDISIEVISTDHKAEFVSLISDEDAENEDISVHADFDQGGFMGNDDTKTRKSDELVGETLEEILNSLGDCDWSTNPEHKPVHINTRGRYYQSKKCEKCNSKGHQSRDCPNKILVCLQCGEKGHQAKTCPRPVCFNCYRTGHTRFDCTEPRRSWWKKCNSCEMQGHKEVECPNRWRQFHLTTDIEDYVRGSNTENSMVYCSNCGKKGHFYHDCIEEPMYGKAWETWPFIVKYNLDKEMNSLIQWRDKSLKAQNDDVNMQKGKSKKAKVKHSKTVINTLDNPFVKKKGKKRKWESNEETVEETPSTSLNKRQRLEPHIKKNKKNKKKKGKLRQDEGVSYDQTAGPSSSRGHHSGHDSRYNYRKHHKVKQNHNEKPVEQTTQVKKKKNKKKKHKQNSEDHHQTQDSVNVSQKKMHFCNYQSNYTSTNSRGFRLSFIKDNESGSSSHGHREGGKPWKKWDRKQQDGGDHHTNNRQNRRHWDGGNRQQGRKRKWQADY